MVFACVKGKSSSNCPNRTFNAFFGNPIPWPRSLYFSQPSPMAPLAFAASTEMSSSIQKERFWPKLPALMIVKVLGANKSVRGVNPVWVMKPAGCLRFNVKLPSVPEGNGQKARNLARVHGAGKSFFLGFRAKENWGFLDEGFVIFRELEAVFLECFPEVVQFRIVVVAGSARGLVLPGERRNGRTLGSRRQYPREHHQGRNYRKENTVPRMVSHHNRSS